ncbi:MAG: hypothetical protein EHM72_14960 [Calditrichaeota bacterium]|nr:MAG: hypothetical protein EHM72_14960 [Calditrichota bacterium]
MNKKQWLLSVGLLLCMACCGVADVTTSDSLKTPVIKRDRLFSVDKGHHLTVSAMITGLSYYALYQEQNQSRGTATRVSLGVAFSFGAAKEIYDGLSGKGQPSLLDIVADIAGMTLAVTLLNISSN